jgi:homoserine kinase
VVLVPDEEETETASARAALSQNVPLADAVFNLSRSALAVTALTVRPDLLSDALQDRLHERHRLAMAPGAEALFDRLSADGFPVCVAGSGPSLLAFESEDMTVEDPGSAWRVLRPTVASRGATLSVDE